MQKIKNLLLFLVAFLFISFVFFIFTERHFLIRYYSYSGDPLTTPISWFDPTEVVGGGADDNLPIAYDNNLTISMSVLDEVSSYAQSQSSQALIIIHKGNVQLEKYWDGADRSRLFNPQSMSKTVLGALIGIAISEGYIQSVDDAIGLYIEEWRNDPRGEITIRQALEMSAGLEQMSTSYELSIFNRAVRHHFGNKFDRMTLDLKQIDPPGSKYEYNNEESNLLGILIERATGFRYADYLSLKLWHPLELADAQMYLDREGGSVMKSCCILSRPYDWAKIGQLFLNNGLYEGEYIIPSDWINQMVEPSKNSDSYGLQVWLGSSYIPAKNNTVGVYDKNNPPLYLDDEMIIFVGYGGQRVWISRLHNLVIVNATKNWSNAWIEAKIPNTVIRSFLKE